MPNNPQGRTISIAIKTRKGTTSDKQRIDVIDQQHFGCRDDQRADERASETVETTHQRGWESLEADDRHAAGRARIERHQDSGKRAG